MVDFNTVIGQQQIHRKIKQTDAFISLIEQSTVEKKIYLHTYKYVFSHGSHENELS